MAAALKSAAVQGLSCRSSRNLTIFTNNCAPVLFRPAAHASSAPRRVFSAAPASYENLLIEVRGKVVIITLNRPKALNALNQALMNELVDAVGKFDADPNIGAIVLTGWGLRVFLSVDMKCRVLFCRVKMQRRKNLLMIRFVQVVPRLSLPARISRRCRPCPTWVLFLLVTNPCCTFYNAPDGLALLPRLRERQAGRELDWNCQLSQADHRGETLLWHPQITVEGRGSSHSFRGFTLPTQNHPPS